MSQGTPFANVLLVATSGRDAMTPAATLDHAGIEALIPHRGTMCLLDRLIAWDADADRLQRRRPPRPGPSAAQPQRPDGGARRSSTPRRRWRCTAACWRRRPVRRPSPGYLASARDVRLGAWRLDDLPAAEATRSGCVAERQAGDAGRLLYAFRIAPRRPRRSPAGALAVVLDAAAAAHERRAHPRPARPRHRRQRRHRPRDRRAAGARRRARDRACQHAAARRPRRSPRRSPRPAAAPRRWPSTCTDRAAAQRGLRAAARRRRDPDRRQQRRHPRRRRLPGTARRRNGSASSTSRSTASSTSRSRW